MTFSHVLPTVGVEEEYQLVDLATGELVPTCRSVLREAKYETRANLQHELHLEQIEMASPILDSSESVRNCISRTRAILIDAAAKSGSGLVSAGCHPMKSSERVHITPLPRYEDVVERLQAVARVMIFGCHVHVDMPDQELGVQVMNYARPWLPLLQAMTGNSPFWNGEDTGYASYRRELWSPLPLTGVPSRFKNFADYSHCIADLVSAGAIDDETRIYWDLRLPKKTPTIEFRVFDALTDVEDVVAIVAITRALVMRCELAAHQGDPLPTVRPEVLRYAMWQAARYGLSASLIDPFAVRQTPAHVQLDQLAAYIAKPLQILRDQQLVEDYIEQLKRNGAPAEVQRQLLAKHDGRFEGLIDELKLRTASGALRKSA